MKLIRADEKCAGHRQNTFPSLLSYFLIDFDLTLLGVGLRPDEGFVCLFVFTRGRAESPRRTGYFGCLPTPLRGCVSRPSTVRERRQKVWRGGLAWGELELKAQRLHLSLGPVPAWNTGALENWPGVSGLPSSVTRRWQQNWNESASRLLLNLTICVRL